ncbi:flagellar assembly protein FliW [Metabacillus halosaccharovorans]|uniref:flagellar assembly protein FliW n=1 Tax=Metabacillus halosaccharovorans TaxID=930124 RepID=UPI000994EE69|nr:flagellar assembly protein FliW [Metabacillus halosaccharovorans]
MLIETKYHGEIDIDDNEIIKFVNGIPGFNDEKKFTLLSLNKESPFLILQSIETAGLGFIVVDPFVYTTDYEFDLTDSDKDVLKISNEKDVNVLAIITLKDSLKESTVNLMAPVIINHQENLGKQIILNNSNYSIRHRLFANLDVK